MKSRMRSRVLQLDDPPEDLVAALLRILAEQRGSEVLVNYRRLRKAGYRGDPVHASMYLDSALAAGFPDPLDRGVWRVKRVGRNGNRKKYYLTLEKGKGGGELG
jgi:hypothetical protein